MGSNDNTTQPNTEGRKPEVSAAEVDEILERIADGTAKPVLADPERDWDMVYAGEVSFLVDGWRIDVFNDCDSFDYFDAVTAPDGRHSEYDDWADWTAPGAEYGRQPGGLIFYRDHDRFRMIQEIFIAAGKRQI